MPKNTTKSKKSVKKRTTAASLKWTPKPNKKLVPLDLNNLDNIAPDTVTEALTIPFEIKAHTLITNTFKKFRGNAHEQTREDIREHYKNQAYKEIPYKSVYQLHRDCCNRSKQKNIKLQSSKTWSPPEHPKGISSYHHNNEQKIAEKDLKQHEKLAFRLLSNALKNFPANASDHNKQQRDKIKAHYRKCAYKNFQPLDITTLFEMAAAKKDKKKREKRIHPPKKKSPTWSPPQKSGLVTITTTPEKKKPSNEHIAILEKRAYNIVRNSLIKFPIKSKEISPKNKKNNQKTRDAIHAYYDTHAFSDLRHVSLGTLAKRHKNRIKIKQEVTQKGARDTNAQNQGAEQEDLDTIKPPNFDFPTVSEETTTELMDQLFGDDDKGLLDIDLSDTETQSPKSTRNMEAFLKPVTPAKTRPKEAPIETQKRPQNESPDERLVDTRPKKRRKGNANI